MNLLELYNKIDLTTIEDFISLQQEENLNIDFKTVNNSDLTHPDDKKNLARALSGYSNSDGGLIIWGIKANKNQEGIDCAQEKVPIINISLFLSRLNELTGRAVNPLTEGVLHKAIRMQNDNGFAVSYIPASDSGPHMAKFGEDRYFKRSGDSFYRMEHYDIEDMFGRRKKPKLILIYSTNSVKVYGEKIKIGFLLKLKNIGRGSACAPFIQISKNIKVMEWSEYGFDGNRNFGLDPLNYFPEADQVTFTSDSTKILHPHLELPLTVLTLNLVDHNFSTQIKDITLDYSTTSENIILNSSTLVIKKEDIYQDLRRHEIDVNV